MTTYSAFLPNYLQQGSGAPSGAPNAVSGTSVFYWDTTGHAAYVYDWVAAAWESVGGGGGFNPFAATSPTKPTAAGLTLTQGTALSSSAALTDLGSGRGVLLSVPDHTTGGTNNVATAGKASLSNTAQTVQAFIHRDYLPYGGGYAGVYIKDNAGKFVANQFYEGGTSGLSNHQWQLGAWASVNSFTGAITSNSGCALPTTAPFWLKMQIASGNLISSFSADGENYSVLDSRSTSSISSYLGGTLAEVGFFTSANDAGGGGLFEQTHNVNCYELDSTTP